MQTANRAEAAKIVESFLPLFEHLNEKDVGYCLVGGLGVIMQGLRAGGDSFRITGDADILIPQSYSIAEFIRDYLDVYGQRAPTPDSLYNALFGDVPFESLYEDPEVNTSIVGADEEIDGFDTPSIDICKSLNGKTAEGIDREQISEDGISIWVATAAELLDMKEKTASLYRATPENTSRPQDFADMTTLRKIIDSPEDTSSDDTPTGFLGRLLGR